ncbi:MAG: transposase [Actinomycetota bacterium]|nr:transposase [Actinomycetota bacterium]
MRFLIRDRDAKYRGSFDEVLRTEAVHVTRTPIRAPRANAVAERWVRTIRGECLDRTLLLSRSHLERVLRRYVAHYNRQRPHRGLQLRVPVPCPIPLQPASPSLVRGMAVLGGLIREYHVDAT